jgi:hypothetical protein
MRCRRADVATCRRRLRAAAGAVEWSARLASGSEVRKQPALPGIGFEIRRADGEAPTPRR